MAISIRTGQVAGLAEFIRDTTGAALVAGDGMAVTVSDAGDTITLDATVTTPTYREVLMSSDGTATPLTNGAGDDWLYGEVSA